MEEQPSEVTKAITRRDSSAAVQHEGFAVLGGLLADGMKVQAEADKEISLAEIRSMFIYNPVVGKELLTYFGVGGAGYAFAEIRRVRAKERGAADSEES